MPTEKLLKKINKFGKSAARLGLEAGIKKGVKKGVKAAKKTGKGMPMYKTSFKPAAVPESGRNVAAKPSGQFRAGPTKQNKKMMDNGRKFAEGAKANPIQAPKNSDGLKFGQIQGENPEEMAYNATIKGSKKKKKGTNKKESMMSFIKNLPKQK